MTTTLGERIKRLRLARDLTLKQVGEAADISPTHLSEIERGKTSPTVGALVRIASALDEVASCLIDDAPARGVLVVRAGERRQLMERGATLHLLSGEVGARELTLVEMTVAPGVSVPRLVHGGELFLLVREGTLDVDLPTGRHGLRAGDAVHCVAGDCREIRNPGELPARLIWAASPAVVL
jgi:transcriptional regulator with XRE-family HTH domain